MRDDLVEVTVTVVRAVVTVVLAVTTNRATTLQRPTIAALATTMDTARDRVLELLSLLVRLPVELLALWREVLLVVLITAAATLIPTPTQTSMVLVTLYTQVALLQAAALPGSSS